MSKNERTEDLAPETVDATPTVETKPPADAPSTEAPAADAPAADAPAAEAVPDAGEPASEAPDADTELAVTPVGSTDSAAEDEKKKKKKKKKKRKDPASAATKEVALTEEQKEAIRLRAESRLKKEYERTVDARLRADLEVDEAELKSLKKKLVKAQGSPERGIETWFRLTSRNLYTRRQIVDTKSNILITVNSIILSVVLGTMSREIADQPHLAIAIVPLVVANLFSIAFAIFATKPKVALGVFTPEELAERKVSLMTFDDFYRMNAEDYEAAIDRVLDDRNLLYGTIQRDIYSLGIDLSQRYQQIQRSYSVFLTGIVFATLLFGATSYYFA